MLFSQLWYKVKKIKAQFVVLKELLNCVKVRFSKLAKILFMTFIASCKFVGNFNKRFSLLDY